MATSVELDALLYEDLRGNVGCRDSFSLILEKAVQVGDVRLMVLAVVQLHNLGGDMRLQCL